MSNSFTYNKRNLLILTLFIGSLWLFTGCSTKSEAEETVVETMPVVVERPVIQTISESYTTKGSIQSKDVGIVTSKIPGNVEHILVDEGDTVRKGKILVSLDKTQLHLNVKQARQALAQSQAAVAQAEASVMQAEANYSKASRDYERISRLYEQESIAKTTFDDAQTGRDIAKASLVATQKASELAVAKLEAAEISLEIHQTYLNDADIQSPLSGVLTVKSINVGEYIQPGRPLFTVETAGSLELKASVPAQLLGKIERGGLVNASIDGSLHNLSLSIDKISPSLDEKSRSAEITCYIDNSEGKLYPGQYATVQIILQRKDDALTVSRDSLIRENDSISIFLVQDGKAVQQTIETGIVENNRVEVLTPLSADAQIIVVGQNRVQQGSVVKLVTEEVE